MSDNLERRIKTLAQWLYESHYLVVFTGAGIITASELPDFRGPDGLWELQDKGSLPISISTPRKLVERVKK